MRKVGKGQSRLEGSDSWCGGRLEPAEADADELVGVGLAQFCFGIHSRLWDLWQRKTLLFVSCAAKWWPCIGICISALDNSNHRQFDMPSRMFTGPLSAAGIDKR
jgi:hypothetical protein